MLKNYINPQTYTTINGLGSLIYCSGWGHQLDIPNSNRFKRRGLFDLVNQLMTLIVKQKVYVCRERREDGGFLKFVTLGANSSQSLFHFRSNASINLLPLCNGVEHFESLRYFCLLLVPVF